MNPENPELYKINEEIEFKKAEDLVTTQQTQTTTTTSIKKRRYTSLDRLFFEIRDLRADLAKYASTNEELLKNIQQILKEITVLKDFIKELNALLNLHRKWADKMTQSIDDSVLILRNVANTLEEMSKHFNVLVVHEKEILEREKQIIELLRKWKLPEI